MFSKIAILEEVSSDQQTDCMESIWLLLISSNLNMNYYHSYFSSAERTSECRKDLEKLRAKLKARYAVVSSNREYNPAKYYSAIPSKWRMNGTLVAHLHEHKASVVKLTSLKPYGPLFASGSADGTVRLWDCNKLNGNHSINKSKQVYSANTPINALAACEGGQSLAVGGKNGELLIMRIDRNSSKMTLQQALHLDGTSMHEK